MHIDFAPPSNGTYNNAGSSRQLANYMEHEDLERIEKGIYTEGFFNLTNYNPQIEMFARFKMKSSFHKTKRII